MRLTYATRRSALALAQCRAFCERIKASHPAIELVELQIVTSGDKIQDRPLSEVGGKGLFVKEIEEALLDRRADFAVHSIKDVPGQLPDGLGIACIPSRVDPRDALVSPKHGRLASLPTGARIGTSSLRRMLALKAARPDVEVIPVRGNVDTRLRKVDSGEYDAIVLAMAGLTRLALAARATEVLEPDVSLPAVGQGALGIECRNDDALTREILSTLHDETTGICVAAERGVLLALEGDCKTPIAAFAERGLLGDGKPSLRVRAFVANPDGSNPRRHDSVGAYPESMAAAQELGTTIGRTLKA